MLCRKGDIFCNRKQNKRCLGIFKVFSNKILNIGFFNRGDVVL